MNKRLAGPLAGLMLCLALPAVAGGWERHDRRDWQPRGQGHYQHHHHAPSRSWIVPGLVLGAGIVALDAFRPPTVVVAPAAPVIVAPPPPARIWYFCDLYQAYYPYVQNCPGGWRPVPTP